MVAVTEARRMTEMTTAGTSSGISGQYTQFLVSLNKIHLKKSNDDNLKDTVQQLINRPTQTKAVLQEGDLFQLVWPSGKALA